MRGVCERSDERSNERSDERSGESLCEKVCGVGGEKDVEGTCVSVYTVFTIQTLTSLHGSTADTHYTPLQIDTHTHTYTDSAPYLVIVGVFCLFVKHTYSVIPNKVAVTTHLILIVVETCLIKHTQIIIRA